MKTDSDTMEDVKNHEEYTQLVQIKQIEKPPAEEKLDEKPVASSTSMAAEPIKKDNLPQIKESLKKKKMLKTEPKKEKAETKKAGVPHYPELEGAEGFDGRRPLVDPYEVGEVTELELSYLGMSAGSLIFETLPFVEVNGKKAYHFRIKMKSSDGFAMFYKIDNFAETYLDYETLVPYGHEVHIKESKQVKETRSFFDWESGVGRYWEKKVTKKGEKNKKKEWQLVPDSQNLSSSLFYFRSFPFRPKKTLSFNVADAGKQNIIKGNVIAQETIKVPAGTFETNVLQIQYQVDGTFQQIGDVFIYITDDDRRRIVKIKAKIKIGSIVGEAVRLK
ncbi:MAG: DUF3108 domain-containing protein [Bdellovibrionales bacterium]